MVTPDLEQSLVGPPALAPDRADRAFVTTIERRVAQRRAVRRRINLAGHTVAAAGLAIAVAALARALWLERDSISSLLAVAIVCLIVAIGGLRESSDG
ncbi:MAG TPA: hypothetical protein VF559_10035 [Caulobacteraceae bacterium]|jgi:hypothetical protein